MALAGGAASPADEPHLHRRVPRNAEGPAPARSLFEAYNRRERVFYLGDLSFRTVIRGLAARNPSAVALEPEPVGNAALPPGEARLTELGLALVEGRGDWVRNHGVDRWMGGLRLEGREVGWRWDSNAGGIQGYPGGTL